MLEVRNLHKRYSGIPAVDSVSFIARAGEVTGYLGANGSGKSTTMKMATGLIEPSAGEILFEGRRIKENLMAYRQRMGYVPEEPHLYTHLSGLEYLVMVAQLRNMDRTSANMRIHGLLRLFGIHGDRDVALVVLLQRYAAEDSAIRRLNAQPRRDSVGRTILWPRCRFRSHPPQSD